MMLSSLAPCNGLSRKPRPDHPQTGGTFRSENGTTFNMHPAKPKLTKVNVRSQLYRASTFTRAVNQDNPLACLVDNLIPTCLQSTSQPWKGLRVLHCHTWVNPVCPALRCKMPLPGSKGCSGESKNKQSYLLDCSASHCSYPGFIIVELYPSPGCSSL